MSDNFLCPYCRREFSREDMVGLKTKEAKQRIEDDLKESFMKESGWSAKQKKVERMFYVAAFGPFVFYCIIGGLLLKYASGDTFLYYLGPLMIGTVVVMLLGAVMVVIADIWLKNKADQAFSERRLMSGN